MLPHYRAGILAAAPFALNVVALGAILGVAARGAGQGATEFLTSVIGVNAATSQLAALDYWRGYAAFGDVVLMTLLLNAKSAISSADLWGGIRQGSFFKKCLIGFTVTDSNWICCRMAAQRGELTPEFALANGWTLLFIWGFGGMIGYCGGAIMSAEMLQQSGVAMIGVLSMAAIVAKSVKHAPDLVLPAAITAMCAIGLNQIGLGMGPCVIVSTFAGAGAAVFARVP